MPKRASVSKKKVLFTTVVNISNGEECDVRIDRGTVFGNYFREGKDGTREEVIEKYKKVFYSSAKDWLRFRVLQEIPRGSRLGCHCAPKPCHGQVIADFIDNYSL